MSVFDEYDSENYTTRSSQSHLTWEDVESMDAKSLVEHMQNRVYGKQNVYGNVHPAPNEIIVKSKKAKSLLSVNWNTATPVDYTKPAVRNTKHTASRTTTGIDFGAMKLAQSGFVSEQVRALMELGTYHAAAGGDIEDINDIGATVLGLSEFDIESLMPILKGNWTKRAMASTTSNKIFTSEEGLKDVSINLDAFRSSSLDEDEAFDFGAANISALYLAKANQEFGEKPFELPVAVVARASIVLPESSFRVPDGLSLPKNDTILAEEYRHLVDVEAATDMMHAQALNILDSIDKTHAEDMAAEYQDAYKAMLKMNYQEKTAAKYSTKKKAKDDVINYEQQPKFVIGSDTDELKLTDYIREHIGKRLLEVCLTDSEAGTAWWKLGMATRNFNTPLDEKDVRKVLEGIADSRLIQDIARDARVLPLKIPEVSARILRYFSKTFQMPVPDDAQFFAKAWFTACTGRGKAIAKWLYQCWILTVVGKYELNRILPDPDAVAMLADLKAKAKNFTDTQAQTWSKHYKAKWKHAKDKTSKYSIIAQSTSKWFKAIRYEQLVMHKQWWFDDDELHPLTKSILSYAEKRRIVIPSVAKTLDDLITVVDKDVNLTVKFRWLYSILSEKTQMLYEDILKYIAAVGKRDLTPYEQIAGIDLPIESVADEMIKPIFDHETVAIEPKFVVGSLDMDFEEDDFDNEWPDLDLADAVAVWKGYSDLSAWEESGDNAAFWGSEECSEAVVAFNIQRATANSDSISIEPEEEDVL